MVLVVVVVAVVGKNLEVVVAVARAVVVGCGVVEVLAELLRDTGKIEDLKRRARSSQRHSN